MDKCCKDKCHSEKDPLIFNLLVKSLPQNSPNNFLFRKMQRSTRVSMESRYRHLLPSLSFWPKQLLANNFFGKLFFLSKNSGDPKLFWTQNIFGPNIFLDPRFFLNPKLFFEPKFFWTKIYFDQNFFSPKIFLNQHFFGPKNYFDPNPKFIWIQIF